jgi:hypothetical membrane protein
MERNPLKWPVSCIGGLAVILLYCVFTFTSAALYPPPYGPATNWLSDLGSWSGNPRGAIFYNVGCVVTGLALFPFYIGLYKWYDSKIWRRTMLTAGQLLGLCSAFSLMMIGVFSADSGKPHLFWSAAFFTLNFVALLLVITSIMTHLKFMKLIGVYGYIVTFASLIFDFTVHGPLVEWFTVFTGLGFVGLLVINMLLVAFPAKKSR